MERRGGMRKQVLFGPALVGLAVGVGTMQGPSTAYAAGPAAGKDTPIANAESKGRSEERRVGKEGIDGGFVEYFDQSATVHVLGTGYTPDGQVSQTVRQVTG